MLFAVGFLLNFLIGGITGVMVASPPLDYRRARHVLHRPAFPLHDRGRQPVRAVRRAVFLVPEDVWRPPDERLGKWTFALIFIGFNATFCRWASWGSRGWRAASTPIRAIGHLALLNAHRDCRRRRYGARRRTLLRQRAVSARAREPVADNPWQGYSLEWMTSSPPPEFNFRACRRSAAAARLGHRPGAAP